MALYDEIEVEEQIRALPTEVRAHLAHVVRNGLMNILASYKHGDVEAAIAELENKWKGLGL